MSLLQALAFPAAVALVFLFPSQLFPLLPHAFQDSIRDGAAGLILGYAAALVLIGSAVLTLRAIEAPAAKTTFQSTLDGKPLPIQRRLNSLGWNLNLLQMLAFPAAVALVILFQLRLFPLLPHALQEDIVHGAAGLFLAYVAGLVMVLSAALTWRAIEVRSN